MKGNEVYAKVLQRNTILIASMVDDLEKVTKSLCKYPLKVTPNFKVFKVIIRDVEGNYYLLPPNKEIIKLNTKNEKEAMTWKPSREQYWDNV